MNTLTLYDGTTGASIDMAARAVAGEGYQPMAPTPEVVYSASPYADGARPVASRAGNVVETITVDLQGTSVDDVFAQLAALHRLLYNARDYYEMPGRRSPCYMMYQPDGMTNAVYATIAGGVVENSPDINEAASTEQFILTGVRVTLEREPYYRETPPVRDDNYCKVSVINTDPPAGRNADRFGTFTLDGTTYPTVPGHVPALAEVQYYDVDAGHSYSNVIIAYRSAARFPAPANYPDGFFPGGVIEAEGASALSGFAVSATSPTTKSGGSSLLLTLAGSTGSGSFELRRGTAYSKLLAGRYRVFARMKTTASVSASITLTLYNLSKVMETPAVTFANAAWTMVDLGIINAYALAPTSLGEPTAGYYTYPLQNITASISCTGGPGTLDIDCFVLMPVDEYYLTLTGATADYPLIVRTRASTIEPAGFSHPALMLSQYMATNDIITGERYLSNTTPIPSNGVGTGALYLPPGAGTLTYLVTGANWSSEYSATQFAHLSLYRVARYFTARGAG